MKHLTVISGLALIPLCTVLGSFVPVGTGNGVLIGLVLGIILSHLFFTRGPGRPKSPLPTSFYLNHQHQDNGGINEQALTVATLRAQEGSHPGTPFSKP